MNEASERASRIVALLNEAFGLDPEALSALHRSRVPCNEALARHPAIQVRRHDKGYDVGLVGLLNGLSGVDAEGRGAVAAIVDIDVTPHRLLGFEVLDRSVL